MTPPPEDRSEVCPFAPDALTMVLMATTTISTMVHPLLFAVAITVWGVYIFHRALLGSRHRHIARRARTLLWYQVWNVVLLANGPGAVVRRDHVVVLRS